MRYENLRKFKGFQKEHVTQEGRRIDLIPVLITFIHKGLHILSKLHTLWGPKKQLEKIQTVQLQNKNTCKGWQCSPHILEHELIEIHINIVEHEKLISKFENINNQ
jgi:hypothetical protein